MKVPTLSALLSERERKMIRFECDYAEGMHPRILERLVETNMEQTAMARIPTANVRRR